MTRGIKKYRPSSELKDHHDLIRIAAGIRANERRPKAMKQKMLLHVTELLKLFAADPTLGMRDPAFEAEEKRKRVEEKAEKERKARSRALEEHVRTAESSAESRGTVPEYGAR